MTIADLPTLDPIQAHFLNSRPLDNDFANFIQKTEFYKESRSIRVDYWKIPENKLAYQLKFNANSPTTFKQEAVEKYGQEVMNNASRHFSHLLRRTNVSPVSLQVAAIAWYVSEMIDIEKTKEQNKWD